MTLTIKFLAFFVIWKAKTIIIKLVRKFTSKAKQNQKFNKAKAKLLNLIESLNKRQASLLHSPLSLNKNKLF